MQPLKSVYVEINIYTITRQFNSASEEGAPKKVASDSPFMQIMSTCKDVVIFQPHTSTVSQSVDLLRVL